MTLSLNYCDSYLDRIETISNEQLFNYLSVTKTDFDNVSTFTSVHGSVLLITSICLNHVA